MTHAPLPDGPAPDDRHLSRRAQLTLLGAIALTAALWIVPGGDKVGYPLLLISTVAHEMGHGIAALIVGGEFHSLRMWSNGAGVASVGGFQSGLPWALVSAGGLVGPAICAALLFFCARYPRLARASLLVLGAALLLSLLLVVRGAFGLLFVGLLGAGLLAAGRFGSGPVAQVLLGFLAVQLSLSVFARADYLFTRYAETGAGRMPSDTANIASALGGPHWLWGGLCGAFSVLVLLVGASFLLWGRPLPRLSRRPPVALSSTLPPR